MPKKDVFERTVCISGQALHLPSVELSEWAERAGDGNYILKIESIRNLAQNRLLHRLIEEYRLKCLDEYGQNFTAEQAKVQFKIWTGFYFKSEIRGKNGVKFTMPIPKESSRLSKKAFSEWMKIAKSLWIDEFFQESITLMSEEMRHYLGLNK